MLAKQKKTFVVMGRKPRLVASNFSSIIAWALMLDFTCFTIAVCCGLLVGLWSSSGAILMIGL